MTPPPPPPVPRRATRVFPSNNGIHEISATTPPPTATSALDQLLPPFLLEEAPSCTLVPAISPGVDPYFAPSPLIAECGPGLSSGIVTVGDTSFATRIQVHNGPSASNRYGLVALLDNGSPQTFNSADAWARMKHSNAASGTFKRHTSPRS